MSSAVAAEPVVVLDGVTKAFGRHVAVDDLSLTIPRGSVYGFIGPNGAGKTSTIRMIMHIHAPDRGRVEVLGRPAGRETARRVGYLPEERGLYAKMRVFDQLLFYGRLKGRSRAELTPKIDRWLERFGLTPWRQKKCQELSKGMQQKVQFVGTVLHEPELVILDEPFSGLDPVNAQTLQEIVEQFRRERRTVIFSTHVMEHAEKLCDAVFMICKGKKVLDGPVEEIRRRFREDKVEIVGEGDPSVFEGASGVRSMRAIGGRIEFDLEPGADPQQLLELALPRFKVSRFEVRAPRLHDVFVRIAGADATASPHGADAATNGNAASAAARGE